MSRVQLLTLIAGQMRKYATADETIKVAEEAYDLSLGELRESDFLA